MAGTVYTHGVHFVDDSPLCCFNLWAPDVESVAVAFADGESLKLRNESDGWFRLETYCEPDTAYHFVIDDEPVPDPASRRQLRNLDGLSMVVDHRTYQWKCDSWLGRPWHESIIYQVHVGLLGGFSGLRDQLPYLKALGVTAIQLMPIGEFPGQRNWGYDGVLPFAPDSSYGAPDELKELIDSAHALGLMVFVDVVYNHFGPVGNYIGRYASGFFRDDAFTPWGPAIDFRQQAVRDFFSENALMWVLDYRVDGLRFDAAHAIADDHFLPALSQRLRAAVPSQRHLHLILENEHNSASLLSNGFDAQWNDDGHNLLHVMLTGEEEGYYGDFSQRRSEALARLLQEGFVYQGQTNRHGEPRGESSGHLPATAFVLFLQNHDQIGNRARGERLINLCPADALKAATALMMLSPMIPLLFMGEEWGCRSPFLYFTDFEEPLATAVREGRRREFEAFSNFADGDALPDPNAEQTFTLSRPGYQNADQADSDGWQQYYHQLFRLRQEQLLPLLGSARSLGARVIAEGAVAADWQLDDNHQLHLAINLGEETVHHQLPGRPGEVIFQHRIDDIGGAVMAPYSFIAQLRATG